MTDTSGQPISFKALCAIAAVFLHPSTVVTRFWVLIDGARVHLTRESQIVHDLFETNGIFIVQNAAYSPDFAPVELFFNVVKKNLTDYQNSSDLTSSIIQTIYKIKNDSYKGFYREAWKHIDSNSM